VSARLRLRFVVLLVIPIWVGAFTVGVHQAAVAAPARRRVVHDTIAVATKEQRAAIAPAASMSPLDSGEHIYRTTCVACHGATGSGAPQTTVGFSNPLPDFTDCNFASRETSADWYAIVRDGGPVRGFSRIMPAFRYLLTPAQIRNVVAYIHTLCSDRRWPRGEFNLPLAQVTEKAFPEDELVLTGTVETSGPGSVANHLIWEKRFGARDQIELDTPFGFVNRPDSSWAGGLGDISFTNKYVLYSSLKSGTILSGLAGIVLPTGSAALGLGGGTTTFEGSLLGAQLLPARSFLQYQGTIEIPTQLAVAPRAASWSAALGTSVPFSPITRLWSPMVELTGSRDLVSGAPTSWSVVPQMQVTLSALQHVRANVGVNVPVNERDTQHVQLLMYVLWDTFDGPLTQFWHGWCPGCQH
jgi:mono/diheme cytochrome c family protein